MVGIRVICADGLCWPAEWDSVCEYQRRGSGNSAKYVVPHGFTSQLEALVDGAIFGATVAIDG